MKLNPWDSIAKNFDTHQDQVWYGAADNIISAWPTVIDYILKNFPKSEGLRALDFGCGTAKLANKLQDIGFNVTGIDSSEEMIKIAKANTAINLEVGDTYSAEKISKREGPFDLIVAIMVLQFVPEKDLIPLIKSLTKNGHLILVDHNPARLKEKGIKNKLYLADTLTAVGIYSRNPKAYNEIFEKYGLKNDMQVMVHQDKKFIKKYHIKNVTKNPKYMILGYKKS